MNSFSPKAIGTTIEKVRNKGLHAYPNGLNSSTPNQYKACYKKTNDFSNCSIQLDSSNMMVSAFTSPTKLSAAFLAIGEVI
jgi:hypothetical protein